MNDLEIDVRLCGFKLIITVKMCVVSGDALKGIVHPKIKNLLL